MAFLVNGSAIGSPAIPDPITAEWSVEGERRRTHTGKILSMATRTVTLRWHPLSRAEFKAMVDYFDALTSEQVTTITVPDHATGTGVAYATYTAEDDLGIWPQRPEGKAEAHLVMDVTWTFKRVASV